VEIELSVTNPHNKDLVLVAHYGHASLIGPKTLQLGPHEQKGFCFYFAPLVPESGSSPVKLSHPDVGEFWYQVDHTALPGTTSRVPPVRCPVGQAKELQFSFANPLSKPAVFAVASSKPDVFAVAQSVLSFEANEIKGVAMTYTPRSFGAVEEGTVTLECTVWLWSWLCRWRVRYVS
jgi:hypothetical protein